MVQPVLRPQDYRPPAPSLTYDLSQPSPSDYAHYFSFPAAASTGPGTPSTPLNPAATPRASPAKPAVSERKAQDAADSDLEKELIAELDGASDDEPPLAATIRTKKVAAPSLKPSKAKTAPKPPPRKEEEEESEGEILEAVEAASKQKQKQKQKAVPTPAPKTKPSPVRRPGSGLPPKPVATADPPPPKAAESKKRPAPNFEEELIELALPTPPAKRARPSSPKMPTGPPLKERAKERSSFSLALPTSMPAPAKAEPTPLSFPGSGAAVTLPGSSSSSAAPRPAPISATTAPVAAAPAAAALESDEEDWQEVEPSPPPPPARMIVMEEIVPEASPRRPSPEPSQELAMDDGDEDDFEMEEVDVAPYRVPDDDDDFLLDVLKDQETVGAPGSEDTGNENLFGEVEGDVDDDEYSSSEESDED